MTCSHVVVQPGSARASIAGVVFFLRCRTNSAARPVVRIQNQRRDHMERAYPGRHGKRLPGKACAIQNPLRGYAGVAVLLFSKPIMFQGQGQEKSLKNISSAGKSGSPWPYFASVTALEKPCLKSSRVYALFPFPFGLLLPWASSLINFSVF